MKSKIEELRDLCMGKLNKKYNDKLKDFQSDISFKDKFEELDEMEVEKFIKLCDNRIDWSKAFIKELAFFIGFIIAGLTVSLPKPIKDLTGLEISNYLLYIIALVVFALCIVYPAYKRYIDNLNGWTAFKEEALMRYLRKL